MHLIHPKSAPFAWAALLAGALALMGAMAAVYAGPFAPQPTAGESLGRFAGEFLAAAAAGFRGAPAAAPAATPMTIDDMLQLAVSAGGVLAMLLAIVALARREPRRLGAGALALGGMALAFQFVAWVVLLICGVVLLVSVIANIGSIFEALTG
jgi:hypothetical protein